jgi:hypothetical protein
VRQLSQAKSQMQAGQRDRVGKTRHAPLSVPCDALPSLARASGPAGAKGQGKGRPASKQFSHGADPAFSSPLKEDEHQQEEHETEQEWKCKHEYAFIFWNALLSIQLDLSVPQISVPVNIVARGRCHI